MQILSPLLLSLRVFILLEGREGSGSVAIRDSPLALVAISLIGVENLFPQFIRALSRGRAN